MPEPRYLAVGKVTRPHGVRGELRVAVLTDYPERLGEHTHFHLSYPDSPETATCYPVERLRLREETMLLKLDGCNDRNAAEEMRGMLVQIPVQDAIPLEEGECYLFQAIGMAVETEDGRPLGEIVEVIETGANDVFVVHGPYGEVLLPAVEDVIHWADPASKRMVVHVLPGMLQDEKPPDRR